MDRQSRAENIAEWPADELESVPQCPVCAGSRRSLLHEGLTDNVFNIAPGKWNLYQCGSCASAWLDPRPTATSIGMAYSNYYTHSQSDHPIVRRKGVLRSFLHDAINDYRNARYGLERQPANRSGRWLVPLLPSLRAAVDADCRHLPRPPGTGGRLLDVGFGNGGFLQFASEMGWEAEGLDLDPKAVEVARGRGLNVRCAGVSELTRESGQYDVITISHVLEHVHDPLELLRELYRLLKPGGLLWLETPNLTSRGADKFGHNWRGLEPPRHLALFNVPSLKKSLEESGFTQITQRWRGLAVFTVFAASEAITSGREAINASRSGKPPLRDVIAELHEMLVPAKREFITLTARKSAE